MLALPGGPALSGFRLAKLLENAQRAAPTLSMLHAQYVHLVDTSRALSASEQVILEELLCYGEGDSASLPTVAGVVLSKDELFFEVRVKDPIADKQIDQALAKAQTTDHPGIMVDGNWARVTMDTFAAEVERDRDGYGFAWITKDTRRVDFLNRYAQDFADASFHLGPPEVAPSRRVHAAVSRLLRVKEAERIVVPGS